MEKQNDNILLNTKLDEDFKNNEEYKVELAWRNVVLMSLLHLSAIYAVYIGSGVFMMKTIAFAAFLGIFSSLGILCGAHRLWTHRSYKAKLPLQIFLAFFHIMALQNDIYEWSRDHRVHHKYSETDADPHNAKRGFFFAHIGWLLCKKHPDVKEKGKTIDMSDLEKDPLIRFQRTFYIPLVLLIWGFIPTFIPYYFWGESLWNAFFCCVVYRYTVAVNVAWCVNSAAHLWGTKPYDKNINPVECFIRHLMMGEGFHNYHHTFPWDYSASEFGGLDVFNPATAFIDLMAKIGLAYDLKKASHEVVKSKQRKHGDINHEKSATLYEQIFGSISIVLLFIPLILGHLLKLINH